MIDLTIGCLLTYINSIETGLDLIKQLALDNILEFVLKGDYNSQVLGSHVLGY